MTWFKVDDNFAFHPKAIAATPNALGLWVRAGAWCAGQLTDGFVPIAMIGALGGRKRDAERLVQVGLWERVCPDSASAAPAERHSTASPLPAERQPTTSELKSETPPSRRTGDGYQFVDWSEWQPTKAQVKAEREATKKRVQAYRTKRSNGVTHGVTHGVSNTAPTRPDPTRPTEAKASVSRASRSETDTTPDQFETFWDTYDHKVGRKKAITAYRAAIKKVDPGTLIAAAAQYVAWQKSEGKHPTYTKHPATWLHGEHWNDERAAQSKPRTRIQEHMDLAARLASGQERSQIEGA